MKLINKRLIDFTFFIPTGSGKSTIFNLLMKLQINKKGNIYLNDIKIEKFPLIELRKKIGYISSSTYILNSTILENIVYGNDKLGIEEINGALEYCGAMDFMNKLPKGINTKLNERGSNISQGQKQLIVLVRNFLRKPDILLLDEATSSLDSKSEDRILKVINTVFADKIVIIISHRLCTLKTSDNIILLDNGNKVLEGNYLELTNKQLFKNIFLNQLQ